MKEKINAVKAFHTAFKLGHSESPKADLGRAKNCSSISVNGRRK